MAGSTRQAPCSFARLNLTTLPPTGGNIRIRENYLRQDLLLPSFLVDQEENGGGGGFFILPTASSLDRHLESILMCGEPANTALILGSVLARLKAMGFARTLQRLKKVCLMDPGRRWLGLGDDHLALAASSDGDGGEEEEIGLFRSTLRFLFEWFPQAQFCVLSETRVFREEMLGLFPELDILSVRQFCAQYCPEVYALMPLEVEEDEEEEESGRSSKSGQVGKLQPPNGKRASGKLRCVSAQLAFVGDKRIVGAPSRSRAIHGDVVEIEPVGAGSAVAAAASRVSSVFDDDDDGPDDDYDADDGTSSSSSLYQVVAVVSRDEHRRHVVCTLQQQQEDASDAAMGKQQTLVCVPMDSRFPKLALPHSKLGRVLQGKRFLVEIGDWPEGCRMPNARYLRTIGTAGELATESSCVLIECGLAAHDLAFSADALAELPTSAAAVFKLTPAETDLRDRRVVSIDPIGCQDIDDAISLEDDVENGTGTTFELGVHIADVDRFVRSGSALDREAKARSTSVYLEERRLDMLPGVLCENLCSLRPQVDRFAVSALFQIDKHTLRLVPGSRPRFVKSMIHSRYALAYEQAQNLADGKPAGEYQSTGGKKRGWTGGSIREEEDGPWLRSTVRTLMQIGRNRAEDRTRVGGAINLSGDREEVSFKAVDFTSAAASTATEDIALHSAQHLEIHDTIAELMILANEAVARHLLEINPSRALVRTHPPSGDEAKFRAVVDLCRKMGIQFDHQSNRTIAASLNVVRAKCDRATAQYVESLTTRAMSEAQYVCAGSVLQAGGGAQGDAYSAFFHFGLGLEAYTHFTSPIRRYADLVVARQIFDAPAPQPQAVVVAAAAAAAPVQEDEAPPMPLFPAEEEEEDVSWALALGGGSDSDSDDGGYSAPPPPPPPVVAVAPPPAAAAPQVKTQADQEQHTHSTTKSVQDQCDHINIQHRNAKHASQRSTELFLGLYLHSQPRKYTAMVSQIRAEAGSISCFVPLFDLRVQVRLVAGAATKAGDANRELVLLPGVARVQFTGEGEVELKSSSGGGNAGVGYTLHVRDQVELELFVEDKEPGAPRMPAVRGRLVSIVGAASAAATTTTSRHKSGGEDKPFGALLDTMKPAAAQHLVNTNNKLSLYEVFSQQQHYHQHAAASTPPTTRAASTAATTRGLRACFGGYLPPRDTPQMLVASFYGGDDDAQADDDDAAGATMDRARNFGSSTSSASLTKAKLQELEKQATKRMAKLQTEKFESRTKRRMKKG